MTRRAFLLVALLVVASLNIGSAASSYSRALAPLPDRLTDKEFWALSAALSEPPGFFRSENLVSNETMFQWAVPELVRTVTPGSVYLGVAPDQNFTYIAALHPRMAIICDIRRGNLLELLFYKALIQMSASRVEFLSRLFSRPVPDQVGPTSTAKALIDAFETERPDADAFDRNQRDVLEFLERTHGFTLSADDEENVRWIYRAFYAAGPDLTYSSYGNGRATGFGGGFGGARQGFGGGFGRGGMFPSYGDLQVETDAHGVDHAYLTDESTFAYLKDFETRNLLIPITGDFAGTKALRAVGQYLREHGAVVGAFYTSNVEQYLFQQNDDWSRFYSNLAMLPLDGSSMLIRSVPNSYVAPDQAYAHAATMLCPLQAFVTAFTAGKVRSYADAIAMSHQPSDK